MIKTVFETNDFSKFSEVAQEITNGIRLVTTLTKLFGRTPEEIDGKSENYWHLIDRDVVFYVNFLEMKFQFGGDGCLEDETIYALKWLAHENGFEWDSDL